MEIYVKFGLVIHQVELAHTHQEIALQVTHVLRPSFVCRQAAIAPAHPRCAMMEILVPTMDVQLQQAVVITYLGI